MTKIYLYILYKLPFSLIFKNLDRPKLSGGKSLKLLKYFLTESVFHRKNSKKQSFLSFK